MALPFEQPLSNQDIIEEIQLYSPLSVCIPFRIFAIGRIVV